MKKKIIKKMGKIMKKIIIQKKLLEKVKTKLQKGKEFLKIKKL